jgi:hypothetical protein
MFEQRIQGIRLRDGEEFWVTFDPEHPEVEGVALIQRVRLPREAYEVFWHSFIPGPEPYRFTQATWKSWMRYRVPAHQVLYEELYDDE